MIPRNLNKKPAVRIDEKKNILFFNTNKSKQFFSTDESFGFLINQRKKVL